MKINKTRNRRRVISVGCYSFLFSLVLAASGMCGQESSKGGSPAPAATRSPENVTLVSKPPENVTPVSKPPENVTIGYHPYMEEQINPNEPENHSSFVQDNSYNAEPQTNLSPNKKNWQFKLSKLLYEHGGKVDLEIKMDKTKWASFFRQIAEILQNTQLREEMSEKFIGTFAATSEKDLEKACKDLNDACSSLALSNNEKLHAREKKVIDGIQEMANEEIIKEIVTQAQAIEATRKNITNYQNVLCRLTAEDRTEGLGYGKGNRDFFDYHSQEINKLCAELKKKMVKMKSILKFFGTSVENLKTGCALVKDPSNVSDSCATFKDAFEKLQNCYENYCSNVTDYCSYIKKKQLYMACNYFEEETKKSIVYEEDIKLAYEKVLRTGKNTLQCTIKYLEATANLFV